MSSVTGILSALGAAMVLGGAAAAGALVGAWLVRRRFRSTRWLVRYGLVTTLLLAGGVALTRPEARGVVAVFAAVPFVVGGLFAVLDLRRARG